MRIYTLTQPHLTFISTEVKEPQYVESIPGSIRKTYKIGQSLTVQNKKGKLSIVSLKRVIFGVEAREIINALNNYSEKNCKFFIR